MPRRKNKDQDVLARLNYSELMRLIGLMELLPQQDCDRDLYVKLKNLLRKYK